MSRLAQLVGVLACVPTLARVDTKTWLGAEYTPAGASNSLWWSFYDLYEEAVVRELGCVAYRWLRRTLSYRDRIRPAALAGLHLGGSG